jgi:transcriptional regulator with XRE-family HTH domain
VQDLGSDSGTIATAGRRELTLSNILDNVSSMTETSPRDLNHHIAQRVRTLRADAGLSLDALANRSGVSRSMLSLIERGESSPTAVVLEKLATGLGVTLASLFDAPRADSLESGPIARRQDQPHWTDPASGYVRRNVSPPTVPQPMQIVEVVFPPRAHVAFKTGSRDLTVYQQVWLIEGSIDITVGDTRHRLREGDCLAMQLDQPTAFHNPTRLPARYAVVIASEAPRRS